MKLVSPPNIMINLNLFGITETHFGHGLIFSIKFSVTIILEELGVFSLCWQILGLNRNCDFYFFFLSENEPLYHNFTNPGLGQASQNFIQIVPGTISPSSPPSLPASLLPSNITWKQLPFSPFQPPVKLEWQSLGRNCLSLQLQM